MYSNIVSPFDSNFMKKKKKLSTQYMIHVNKELPYKKTSFSRKIDKKFSKDVCFKTLPEDI